MLQAKAEERLVVGELSMYLDLLLAYKVSLG